MKKKKVNNNIWYIICIIIGISIYAVVGYMMRDYLGAEFKIKTVAKIINVNVEKKYKRKKDIDKTDNFTSRYKEYYDYTLTWEFTDSGGKIHQYVSNRTSSYNSTYQIGHTDTVYAYSSDGENFEIFSIGEYVIITIITTVFIVVAIWSYICERKHKKDQANLEEVIRQRVEDERVKNQSNSKERK